MSQQAPGATFRKGITVIKPFWAFPDNRTARGGLRPTSEKMTGNALPAATVARLHPGITSRHIIAISADLTSASRKARSWNISAFPAKIGQ